MLWWDAVQVTSPVHLDPRIRDWVLLPIFVVMFLQGVLRHYVQVLLTDEKKPDMRALQKAELLRRSQRLRANCQFIPPAAVRMRKTFFVQKAFKEQPKQEGAEAPELPQQDPLAMVGMMKQNMATMILPNMIMMGWVSFFFSGFVLVKLPFPLTDRFKDMLQRGIALKTLDPSYVSSLSWYFINLFGLRGLFSLVLGANSPTDDTRMMEQQMAGAQAMQQADPTGNKAATAERTELEIMNHDWTVCNAEFRLVGKAVPVKR